MIDPKYSSLPNLGNVTRFRNFTSPRIIFINPSKFLRAKKITLAHGPGMFSAFLMDNH